ncbi:hypothetical protein KN815_15050 [Streptomyces sp. 4503]|uniref:Uncharacterized protein n=1 Tax=Streptomyces niphimycinicus TaxID=2842201 RepID=A0ABS6CEK5_9ACTN|nr:hypothetical protein [Streptomyces niphimycinicus]MBU3865340.1 hypothetical protein [Streptomyces niphimycinicus]
MPHLDRVADGPVDGEFVAAIGRDIDAEADPGAFADGVLGGLPSQAEVAQPGPVGSSLFWASSTQVTDIARLPPPLGNFACTLATTYG